MLRNRVFSFILCSLLIFSLLFFHFRGVFYPDEGYMLHTAQRMMQGQFLYKDFDFVYTPLTPLLAIISFIFLGESILSARVMALLVSLGTVWIIWKLTNLYTKKIWHSLLFIAIYLAWGPFHINFLWPSMIALSMSILSFYLFVRGEKEKLRSYILSSGLAVCFVFLAKQNLGLAILLAYLIYFSIRRNRQVCLQFMFGVGVGIFSFFTYLLLTGTTMAFIVNFYENLIVKILIEKSISTPLVYGNSWYAFLKAGFYVSPLLISLYAIIHTIKQKTVLLILPLCSFFFFLAGFRPVTDFVHLSPLLAMTGLCIFPLFIIEKNRLKRMALWGYCFVLIGSGLYTALFLGYYRWNTPMIAPHQFLAHPRVNIWVEPKYQQEIPQLTNIIDRHTQKNDQVFINYYAPMLYFLIDRPNPTAYDYISGITNTSKLLVVQQLKKKHVPFVITHELGNNPTNPIDEYITAHYHIIQKVNDLSILQRN